MAGGRGAGREGPEVVEVVDRQRRQAVPRLVGEVVEAPEVRPEFILGPGDDEAVGDRRQVLGQVLEHPEDGRDLAGPPRRQRVSPLDVGQHERHPVPVVVAPEQRRRGTLNFRA